MVGGQEARWWLKDGEPGKWDTFDWTAGTLMPMVMSMALLCASAVSSVSPGATSEAPANAS